MYVDSQILWKYTKCFISENNFISKNFVSWNEICQKKLQNKMRWLKLIIKVWFIFINFVNWIVIKENIQTPHGKIIKLFTLHLKSLISYIINWCIQLLFYSSYNLFCQFQGFIEGTWMSVTISRESFPY